MSKVLTQLTVTKAKPRGRRYEIADGPGGVPGFSLRVGETGVKSFVLRVRVGARQPRITIGSAAVLTLAAARARARKMVDQAKAGIDPVGERRQRTPAREQTVDRLVDLYLDLVVRHNKQRRAADVERMLRGSVLKPWGGRPAAGITHADAQELVDHIALRAPVMANRVQALGKRLFAWAVKRKIVDANPFADVDRPTKERSRERVLSGAELAAIWNACDQLGWPHGPITRLLILTGARRSEVTGMTWVELDVTDGLWRKPASRAKNGEEQVLPLPGAALELIRALPQIDGSPLLFPSRRGGPVTGMSVPKARLDELAGVTGWTHHDFRRSLATALQEMGVALQVTESILGHTAGSRAGIVGVYQRHRYLNEQRAALERWAGHVERLAAGGEGQVVSLRAG